MNRQVIMQMNCLRLKMASFSLLPALLIPLLPPLPLLSSLRSYATDEVFFIGLLR